MIEPRAPFRYWGSKVRMAPWIAERLPAHEHYVEGCAGSAAVLFAKPPTMAETVNDVHDEVVGFFRVLRHPEQSAELIERVSLTPYSLADFKAAGALLTMGGSPVERAWAFFVRAQMAVVPGRSGWSYGVQAASMAKANKPGRWATMPDLLAACALRFANVQVTDWPVVELIERLDAPGTLIFVDPPYLEESRPTSTGASSAYEHDAFDHVALLEAIHRARHASFAVTHYPHPLYDDALPISGDYESHRNVPNGEGRDRRTERLYVLDRGGPHAHRLF